jgi:SAM-dependent methyltransferase
MPSYGTDLAIIHDAGFGGFSLSASPAILDTLRGGGVDTGLVVDLGCGSGIWARELCDAGYQVLGIDQSSAMLKIARRRAPQARFRRASIYSTALPRCAAVTALGEILNYRFDEVAGLESLRTLFAVVNAALLPGGLFIFDIATPNRVHGRRERHLLTDDWALITEHTHSADKTLLTRRITTFRRSGAAFRRTEEEHHLRLYEVQDIAAALRSIGFRVRIRGGYGERPFPRGLRAFLARKPA